MTIQGYQYGDTGRTITHAQLTVAGSCEAIKLHGCEGIVYQYKVASINTNVVIRAEGSNDNTNWFNLDPDETDITQTANGTYAIRYDGEVPYVRFTFVSEAGGAAATIDVIAFIE